MRAVARRRSTVLALLGSLGIAFAAGACASPRCGVVTGPAVASLEPKSFAVTPDWQRSALGETPGWVQANRPIRAMILGFRCSGGGGAYFPQLRDFADGWAQADVFSGKTPSGDPAQTPVLCVFHPHANAVPTHAMPNPRMLPSGVLEGELWEDGKLQTNGAAFLLEAGVVLIARGSAVPRVRAIVARDPTPPPPLPMPSTVHQWTYESHLQPTLHWLFYNGVEMRRHAYASPDEAAEAVRSYDESHQPLRESKKHKEPDRAWVHGSDMYVYQPE